MALDDLGKVEEAIECYNKALIINPSDNDAWNNKGFALNKLGRYKEAIKCLNKAIELDPESPNPQSHKGLALCRMGFFAKGMKFIHRALYLNPNYTNGWLNSALALQMVGRYKDAILSFDRVIELANAAQQPLSRFQNCPTMRIQNLFRLDFKNLFDSNEHTNTFIKFHNEIIPVDKSILSVRCPKLLEPTIPLGVSPKALRMFLGYLYSEELPQMDNLKIDDIISLYVCVCSFMDEEDIQNANLTHVDKFNDKEDGLPMFE